MTLCFLLGVENELVSGSSDKLVIVWKKTASQDCKVSYMTVYNKHLCQVVLLLGKWRFGGMVWVASEKVSCMKASSLVNDNFQTKLMTASWAKQYLKAAIAFKSKHTFLMFICTCWASNILVLFIISNAPHKECSTSMYMKSFVDFGRPVDSTCRVAETHTQETSLNTFISCQLGCMSQFLTPSWIPQA